MNSLLISILFVASTADLETGIALRQDGKLEEAIQMFEEIVASQPSSQPARRELGHALVLAERYQEAIEAYEDLAASSDERWQIEGTKWAGLTYLYLGEIDKALEANTREAELARGSGDQAARVLATWYRGHVLTELDRFGEANASFLDALEIDANDLNTLHLAGVMAARQGDAGSLRYQIEDLQQAVRRSADESERRRVYHLQAELALLQGKPKAALEPAERANRLTPHPLYREALARAHLALDQGEAAEKVYRDIVTSTDERLDIPLYYVIALKGLADVLDSRGQKEEAVSYYEKFLSLWGNASQPLPGVAEAKSRLSEIQSSR
jgi:tetratricopeptide (TPR) repeat protein